MLNFWPKMVKKWTFLTMGPTDEFQTKFSGFSIVQFGHRNWKNLKRVLRLNRNIDAWVLSPACKTSDISVLNKNKISSSKRIVVKDSRSQTTDAATAATAAEKEKEKTTPRIKECDDESKKQTCRKGKGFFWFFAWPRKSRPFIIGGKEYNRIPRKSRPFKLRGKYIQIRRNCNKAVQSTWICSAFWAGQRA